MSDDQAAFESRLTDLYALWVADAPTGLNPRAVASVALARAHGRTAARRPLLGDFRRLMLTFAAAGAIVLLVAGAFYVGSRLREVRPGPTPPPSLGPVPTASTVDTTEPPHTPAPTPTPATTASGEAAVAIVVQVPGGQGDADVVAVSADGRERVLRHLNGDFGSWGILSVDGFIALDGGGAFHLLNLADLSEPITVPGDGVMSWGPNALFAYADVYGGDPCCEVTITDAHDGSVIDLGVQPIVSCCPSVSWAADGSGILINDSGPAVIRLDGTIAHGLAAPRRWPFWPRQDADDGSTVVLCRVGDADCDQLPGGHAGVMSATGKLTTWYSGQVDGTTLIDATYGPGQSGLWLLLERAQGDRHFVDLAYAPAPLDITVVASADVGSGETSFGLMAPDYSLFSISTDYGPAIEPTSRITRLLSTNNQVVALTKDEFVAGFVDAATAASWPGGEFSQR